MADARISFHNVDFAYNGKPVLRSLTLEVAAGEVVLLAAPNGTGKTTALWLAAGMLSPARGAVAVLGRDPFTDRDVLGHVGFLPEGAPLPDTWTGEEVLAFQRDTFPRWDQQECGRLCEAFGLELDKRVRTMSRGQRGKLGLAAVLSTRPEVLLLDEPTLGLDVATRRQFLSEVLGKVAGEGTPILFSGHEIAEAETIADRFALLSGGHLDCDEPVADLLARHRILTWEKDCPDPPEALDVVELFSPMGRRALAHSWDEELAQAWMRMGGHVAPADLETVYLSLTGELDHA